MGMKGPAHGLWRPSSPSESGAGGPASRLTLAAALGLALSSGGCGPSPAIDRAGELPPPAISPTRSDARPLPVDAADAPPDQPALAPPDVAVEAPAPDAGVVREVAMDLAAPAVDAVAPPRPVDAPVAAEAGAPAPDLRPEAPAPVDAAPAPATASLTPVSGSTDLGGANLVDWAHFGLGGAGAAVNRKAGAPTRIRMAPAGTGQLVPFDDQAVTFSWTNGAPTPAVSGSGDGVAIGGAPGLGFRLEVTGHPTRASRLRVFLGVWQAQARLAARVGDEPPLPVLMEDVLVDSLERVYTVTFGPVPAGRPLVLTWTLTALHHMYGNVTLRAATLEDL